MKVGSTDSRSTMPKKLVAYLMGFPMHHSLMMYSKVNMAVNAHSRMYKGCP